MMKQLLTLTALSLLLGAPMAVAASDVCPLEPTPKGFEADARGKALMSTDRGESLSIKVAARLEDGSILIVSASMRDGSTIDLGAVSMLLGAGEFNLDSSRDRFSKAFPVSNIASLRIGMRGTILLEGRCGDESEPPRR